MKLYYHPISSNCRRVLATLFESGRDDVELVQVDLFQGEHKKPEFLAKNPNGKVPTLVDGDLDLWESNAIMAYLASERVWPASKVRYDIMRWQYWSVAHFGPAIGKVVGERVIKKVVGQGDPDETVVAAGLKEFETFAKVLDNHLEGRDYLVGEGLTLADFSVGAALTYAEAAQIPIAHYPHIKRWWDRLEQVEAWKKSAPPRG